MKTPRNLPSFPRAASERSVRRGQAGERSRRLARETSGDVDEMTYCHLPGPASRADGMRFDGTPVQRKARDVG